MRWLNVDLRQCRCTRQCVIPALLCLASFFVGSPVKYCFLRCWYRQVCRHLSGLSFVSLVIWSLYKLPIAVFVLSVGTFCLDFLVLALVFGCGFTISFFCCFLIFLALIIFKRCWCFSLVRGIFYIHLLYEIVKFFISWCLLWGILSYWFWL